jgi:soluble cytochrome b562
MRAATEVLYDSEAALRLVDSQLDELRREPTPAAADDPADALRDETRRHLTALLSQPVSQGLGLAALPLILTRANEEIQAVLASLRDSRTALEAATVEKLQHTSAKLQEVTSATEVAATDILDGLDRAQGLVDRLDEADAAADAGAARAAREQLRLELFAMMGCLQFQDITNQQIAYASSVLTDMESRLQQIARLFDPATHLGGPVLTAPDPRTFDPEATTRNSAERQAVADAIFTAP